MAGTDHSSEGYQNCAVLLAELIKLTVELLH